MVQAVDIRVNKRQLAALQRMLAHIPNALPRVLTRSLNKVGRYGRTKIVRTVSRKINVKQGELRRRNVTISKATFRRLVAKLKITGSRLPLSLFRAKQSRRGVSYSVGRGFRRKTIRGAFIRKMRSGHRGVFRRKDEWTHRYPRGRGSGRKHGLPIVELRGPSVPLVADQIAKLGEAILGKELADRLMREIETQADLMVQQQARRGRV